MFVVDYYRHSAAVFQSLPDAFKDYPCMEVPNLPEGTGRLMVDADIQRIWWEPVPEPSDTPEPDPPKTIDDLEHENVLLRAQVQAMSDRNDFIEDCIAEMAEIVYE